MKAIKYIYYTIRGFWMFHVMTKCGYVLKEKYDEVYYDACGTHIGLVILNKPMTYMETSYRWIGENLEPVILFI